MVAERFFPQLVRLGAPTCTLCGGKVMNGLNCTCAVEAMWLYRASQGKIVTSVCHVRDLTDDCTGGTNLRQMQTVSAHYGITTGKLYQPVDYDTIANLVATGRYGAHLNISYSGFTGTSYDREAGRFRGNHDLFLSNRGHIAGTTRTGDPLATGFVDIPNSLLKNAAGLLDLGGGTTLSEVAGRGKCYAYLTPIDPAVPTTLFHVAFSGKTTLYSGPGGTIVGAVTKASYPVRRSMHNRLWWYQIVAPASRNDGRWFKPSRYTKITVL